MGRSSKPLTILVHPSLAEWEEITKLREQGHLIHVDDRQVTYDLMLGPNAHRMSEAERKWFPNAIMEGRRRRYPTKPGTPIEEDAE